MYKYGKKSLEKLATCHEDLQIIANELIKVMDVTILCGERGEEEQNKAYNEGKSKLQYPKSKHNKSPSIAIDLAPYPIDFENLDRFHRMNGIIEGIAICKGIKVRMGRDFSFGDHVHTELVLEE